MSFILDALKKSESDRQQKVSPGIADVPTANRRAATPRWIPILIGLLVINLAAVLFVLLRPSAPASGNDGTVVAVTPAPAVPPRATTIARNEPAVPVPAPETAEAADAGPGASAANAAATEPDAAVPQADGPAPDTMQETPARQAASVPAPEPAPAPESDESWLTINELRASGAVDLPELHVDLHVYSDNPAERFVFINMQQYRESATMTEGPDVRRITPEGVLLDYRGSTFLLPRD